MMSSIKKDINSVSELTETELQSVNIQVSNDVVDKEPSGWADDAYKQRFVTALINSMDEEE